MYFNAKIKKKRVKLFYSSAGLKSVSCVLQNSLESSNTAYCVSFSFTSAILGQLMDAAVYQVLVIARPSNSNFRRGCFSVLAAFCFLLLCCYKLSGEINPGFFSPSFLIHMNLIRSHFYYCIEILITTILAHIIVVNHLVGSL